VAKHVEITEEHAQQLLSGKAKPKAKGKKRRDEIQHDVDLEAKMTEKVGTHKREKRDAETDSKVSAGDLRGVVSESIARVYEEIWPGMRVRQGDETPDLEIQEEAYILVLSMVCGNNVDVPRRGLKIRESEISRHVVFCKDHS
jgi:hypothetical protein